MFGSVGRTPAVNTGFRAMRGGGDDDDEDEEEKKPMLGREAISLDQVSLPRYWYGSTADRRLGSAYRYEISLPSWTTRLRECDGEILVYIILRTGRNSKSGGIGRG
jgi:hypothetical protein